MHYRKDTSSRTDWDTKQDPPLRPPTQVGKLTWLSDTAVFCSALLACVSEEPYLLQHGDLVYGATYGLVLKCGVPISPLVQWQTKVLLYLVTLKSLNIIGILVPSLPEGAQRAHLRSLSGFWDQIVSCCE